MGIDDRKGFWKIERKVGVVAECVEVEGWDLERLKMYVDQLED